MLIHSEESSEFERVHVSLSLEFVLPKLPVIVNLGLYLRTFVLQLFCNYAVIDCVIVFISSCIFFEYSFLVVLLYYAVTVRVIGIGSCKYFYFLEFFRNKYYVILRTAFQITRTWWLEHYCLWEGEKWKPPIKSDQGIKFRPLPLLFYLMCGTSFACQDYQTDDSNLEKMKTSLNRKWRNIRRQTLSNCCENRS